MTAIAVINDFDWILRDNVRRTSEVRRTSCGLI